MEISLLSTIFDVLLGLSLLGLAWSALATTDLFKAVLLFIAFGLLMALVWVRLNAPDVALAEAAIGAGITGALMLSALARLNSPHTGRAIASHTTDPEKDPSIQWWPFISLVLVFIGLAYSVFTFSPAFMGLQPDVYSQLVNSGVENPVTAVLLNFRGYDTLLEMLVLFVALLGVWSLGENPAVKTPFISPVLDTLSRLLTPVFILVAAYILWVGAHAPGGAFQAGSILGAAGILLLLSGWQLRKDTSSLFFRVLLLAGPLAFVALAAITLLIQGQLLEYPPAQAGLLILILETFATLSIGVTLAALFLGGFPWSKNRALK